MKMHRYESGGFTLTEMVIASAISALVIIGVSAVLLSSLKSYRNQMLLRDTQRSVRFAVDAISRDLRMAGYGIPVPDQELAAWITWAPHLNSNPEIAEGSSVTEPDQLTIVAAFDGITAQLASATVSGGTQLTLKSGQADQFVPVYARVIFIGRLEVARVVSINGNVLTISTHPTQSGHGVLREYPAGTVLERVDVVTYSCRQDPLMLDGEPFIMRCDYKSGTNSTWQYLLADTITDLQCTPIGYSYQLAIEGTTSLPLLTMAPGGTGSYHAMRVTTDITPRNSEARQAWE